MNRHDWIALLSIVVFGILAVFSVVFLFAEVLCKGRIRPILGAMIAGAAVQLLVIQWPLPPSIRLMLPLIAAAVGAAASMSRADWKAPIPAGETQSPTVDGLVGIAGGIVTGHLASLTLVGKWILNLLGQDVIGSMPKEMTEIRVARGCFGFVVGCFSAISLWRLIVRRHWK